MYDTEIKNDKINSTAVKFVLLKDRRGLSEDWGQAHQYDSSYSPQGQIKLFGAPRQ